MIECLGGRYTAFDASHNFLSRIIGWSTLIFMRSGGAGMAGGMFKPHDAKEQNKKTLDFAAPKITRCLTKMYKRASKITRFMTKVVW
jgi:predicted enzyme related to lactoylglutathione lyase